MRLGNYFFFIIYSLPIFKGLLLYLDIINKNNIIINIYPPPQFRPSLRLTYVVEDISRNWGLYNLRIYPMCIVCTLGNIYIYNIIIYYILIIDIIEYYYLSLFR